MLFGKYTCSTAQMLHGRAEMSSKVLEGLLKITRNKLCECSRFSTLSSLVSKTHLSSCYSASYVRTAFVMRCSSQCTYSKKACQYGASYYHLQTCDLIVPYKAAITLWRFV